MSMLNFKYGLHRSLPEYSLATQGTIFVTADEQAMYIDLPQIEKDGKQVGGRIRVSQIITLADIKEWQGLTPPYNTESFYYIVQANALLKCNKTGDNKYEWTQINSTATLDKAVEDLAALIGEDEKSGLRGAVATNATAIAEIQKFVNAQPAKDKAQDDAIAALVDKAGVIEDDLGDLGTVIGYIGEYANVEAITVTPNKNDIALIGGKIMRFDGEWKDYSDLVEEIEGLRALYNELKNSTPNNSAMTELTSRVSALETWKTTVVAPTLESHDSRITAAQDKADEAKGAADIADGKAVAAQEAAEAAQDAADAAQADAAQALTDAATADGKAVAAKAAADAAQEAANTADGKAVAAQGTADAAQEAANVADGKAVAAQGTADAAQVDATKALADAATANNAINDTTNGLNAAHTKAEGAKSAADAAQGAADKAQEEVDALEGVVAEEQKKISQNSSDIAQLNVDLKSETTARENAIAGLKTELLGDIQAADAMKFIDIVSQAAEEEGQKGLPTSGVSIGHTYKAVAEFGAVEGVTIVFADADDQVIHIGDLLIAQGKETNGVITSDLQWLQIPSGYVADYNPALAVVDGVNSATINLTSGAYKDGTNLGSSVGAGDLGAITLQGDIESAIKVEATGNQVTISMAWGTF